MEDEPDLRPLLEQWVEAGITVVLPVVRERNAPLAFLPWTPDAPCAAALTASRNPPRATNCRPTWCWRPRSALPRLATAWVTAAATTTASLAALRDGGQPFTAIGIAWSCGELDADYEPAEHDYPLDAILTEDGWVPEAPLSQPGKGGKTLFSYRLG